MNHTLCNSYSYSLEQKGKYWTYKLDFWKDSNTHVHISVKTFQSKKEASSALKEKIQDLKRANLSCEHSQLPPPRNFKILSYSPSPVQLKYQNKNLLINQPDFPTIASTWKEVKSIIQNEKSYKTFKNYSTTYRLYIEPQMAEKRLIEINHTYLYKYFLGFTNLGKSSVNQIRIVLSHIFRYACRVGYLDENPIKGVEISYKETKKDKDNYITLKEFQKLCQFLQEKNANGALACAMLQYYLGLRVSEALAVRWTDIDLKKKTIFIHCQVDSAGSIVEQLKTKSSKTTLPIPPPLIEFLKRFKKQSNSERLCLNKRGKPLIADSFRKYLKKFNPALHPHQLRHTYITNIVRNCDPKTAAVLARHTNVSTTLNIYTEVDEQYKRKIVNKAFKQPKKESE